ncbi:MAG: four helix bundle protein [Anaerolineae bacterium]|nr:four helix bundle protein [Anaerolineae bacterium]
MNYEEWLQSVPAELTADPLWRMKVYRLALFAGDLGWNDVSRLMQDQRTRSLADQLYRALGSIGANIAEGYSRRSRRDQARFYEYALGSAREARTWYYQGRHVLPSPVLTHRLDLLTNIIRLLLTIIPSERGFKAAEGDITYQVVPSYSLDDSNARLAGLLIDVPMT